MELIIVDDYEKVVYPDKYGMAMGVSTIGTLTLDARTRRIMLVVEHPEAIHSMLINKEISKHTLEGLSRILRTIITDIYGPDLERAFIRIKFDFASEKNYRMPKPEKKNRLRRLLGL